MQGWTYLSGKTNHCQPLQYQGETEARKHIAEKALHNPSPRECTISL